jgi:hypothetical protein
VYQCMRGLSEKVKGREVILKYKMVIISILTNKFVKLLLLLIPLFIRLGSIV